MRIFIAGIDGYLGWPLALYLSARGHDVGGADSYLRRRWVEEMGSWSATPVPPMRERQQIFSEHQGRELPFWEGDLANYDLVDRIFREFEPEAVVHLAECPSAPFSMIDVHHAVLVQTNNITTTLNLLFAMRDLRPQTHLVKLGSMGEYGTPNTDIPEGFFEMEFRNRRDRAPFPRQAPSWYHWSKVHGSNNIMFASKIWGLRATDVMQGVVFGLRIDEMGDDPRLITRLDFDEAFGTAVNRFCCQAVIGHPLTPFGSGGQKRGFIPLRESMQCLTLALENPPQSGEYRVFNQFAEVFDIMELASSVQNVAVELGLDAEVRNLENPRAEMENHYYNPDHQQLFDLGYRPTQSVQAEVKSIIQELMNYKDRIDQKREVLVPDVRWDGRREKVRYLTPNLTG